MVKRIAYVFLAIVLSAILSSCDMSDDVKPRNQDDTKWITADQNIYFSVMYDGNYNTCLGALETLKQFIILVLNLIMALDLSLVIMTCLRKIIFLLT